MAHHYSDFADRTKTQKKKERISKEEEAPTSIPKTNRPVCSNMIE